MNSDSRDTLQALGNRLDSAGLWMHLFLSKDWKAYLVGMHSALFSPAQSSIYIHTYESWVSLRACHDFRSVMSADSHHIETWDGIHKKTRSKQLNSASNSAIVFIRLATWLHNISILVIENNLDWYLNSIQTAKFQSYIHRNLSSWPHFPFPFFWQRSFSGMRYKYILYVLNYTTT
jgi:hypothetical protein